jgi:hypothetical protein
MDKVTPNSYKNGRGSQEQFPIPPLPVYSKYGK